MFTPMSNTEKGMYLLNALAAYAPEIGVGRFPFVNDASVMRDSITNFIGGSQKIDFSSALAYITLPEYKSNPSAYSKKIVTAIDNAITRSLNGDGRNG